MSTSYFLQETEEAACVKERERQKAREQQEAFFFFNSSTQTIIEKIRTKPSRSSIFPSPLLLRSRSLRVMEPVPAALGRRAGSLPGQSRRFIKQAQSRPHFRPLCRLEFHLACMFFWGRGRELEYLERSRVGAGRR